MEPASVSPAPTAFRGVSVPDSPPLRWSAWLMLMGIVLFSGSLYALSITNIRWLGMITPFGGTAFILAWLLLTVSIIKS